MMINSAINENFSNKSLSNVPFRLNQRNSGEFNSPVPSDPKKEGTGKLNPPESSSKSRELSELHQPSLRDLLERIILKLDKIDKIFDKNFDKINENFVKINERFDKLEERMDKWQNSKSSDYDVISSEPFSNSVGVQFIDDDKPKPTLKDSKLQVKTLVEPDMEKENKNFLIEESSGKINFPRLSDINEEGLGKFTFPKALSKSTLVFLSKLSNSRIYVDLLSINQFVLENSGCIPSNSNFLQNWFIYWAEENIAEANREGFFFFKILLLFFFDALALRVIRFTDFLYLYTMYWDIQ